MVVAEEAGAGPGPAGPDELEQKLMHLRRVNESLVERVESFERSQVRIDTTTIRESRKGGGGTARKHDSCIPDTLCQRLC